jgi:hypothetical protein
VIPSTTMRPMLSGRAASHSESRQVMKVRPPRPSAPWCLEERKLRGFDLLGPRVQPGKPWGLAPRRGETFLPTIPDAWVRRDLRKTASHEVPTSAPSQSSQETLGPCSKTRRDIPADDPGHLGMPRPQDEPQVIRLRPSSASESGRENP